MHPDIINTSYMPRQVILINSKACEFIKLNIVSKNGQSFIFHVLLIKINKYNYLKRSYTNESKEPNQNCTN